MRDLHFNVRNGVERAGGIIKSVQYFANIAANTTINAVDVTNTIILWHGNNTSSVTNGNRDLGRLVLLNSTTVQYIVTVDGNSRISFSVLEFYPGVIKSLQSGTVALDGTATATINPVNTARASIFYQGLSGSIGDVTNHNMACASYTLTNSTTITGTINATGAAVVLGFTVVEWF